MTQHEAIRQYINDFGSITPSEEFHIEMIPMEAFMDLGITKLATRISEMRKRAVTRYGKATHYAKYSREVAQ